MLASTVALAAARFGDLAAFATPDGWTLSFAELDHASDEAAVGLAARGVREHDVVALALPSTPDYVVAYAALAKLGAVTVGLNPRSTPAERAAMVGTVDPALVLATSDLAAGLPDDVAVEPVERAERAGAVLARLRRGRSRPVTPGAARRPRPARHHRVDVGHHRHPEGRDVRRAPARGGHRHRHRRPLGRRCSHAVGHAAGPHRLHDQAALVPADRQHRAPPRPLAGVRGPPPDRAAPHAEHRRRGAPVGAAAAPARLRRGRPDARSRPS